MERADAMNLGLQQQVSVTWVSNVLDPVVTRRTVACAPGQTLGAALLQFVPLAPAGFEVTAVLNGDCLPVARHDIVLRPGDNLVMAARPQGGGGGGSNPLATVAMIAVIVVAAVVTSGAAGYLAGAGFSGSFATLGGYGLSAAGTALAAGAGAAAMGIGGYLVSSAFKSSTPDYGSGDSLGASPSYSWEAQTNTLAEGATLPVLYGRFLATPPLIARYVQSAEKNQYLNLQYALAAHKIDAVEGVLINGQPYATYSGTQVDVRLGEINQEPIPYFGDLYEEISVGAKLTTDWVTREIPGSIQGFCVGLAYRLYYANDKGGMSNVTANVQMEYRQKGAAEWVRYRTGATSPVTVTEYRWSAGYWRDARTWVELETGGTGSSEHAEYEAYTPSADWVAPPDIEGRPYFYWRWLGAAVVYAVESGGDDCLSITSNDSNTLRQTIYRDHIAEGAYEVRVRLREALQEGSRYGSDVYWDFTHAIQYDDFAYPCTAVGGVRSLATDQLQSGQPTVKFLLRRDYVHVYDPDAGKYTQKAATNPAWASYDALHNGAQNHPDPAAYGMAVPYGRIVYADFLDWAEWCDEKGYACNLYAETTLNGRSVLDMLGIMGRGSVIQIGSRFTCIVDKPRVLPRQQFLAGKGNIVSQSMTRSWIPMKDRANVLEITYFDKDANYQRQTVEVYQDGFDSADRVPVKAQRTLYACDNRKDALVWGRGMMLRNRYLTYAPSFEVGAEAIHCLYGDLISIAVDELKGGASGRTLEDATAQIVIDREVVLYPGVQYAVEVQHIDDDERESAYVVAVNQEAKTDTLLLVSPLQKTLGAGSNYAFGEVGRTTKLFTVTDMQTASDQRKRLQLLEYVPEVYNDEVLNVPDADDTAALFVRGLRAVELWTPGGTDGSGRSVIGVSWRGNALYWYVWYRKSGNNAWVQAGRTAVPTFTVQDALLIGQTYEIAVSLGTADAGEKTSITLQGKTAPPSDVTEFRATVQGAGIRLDWAHVPDPDLWAYEIRLGASWSTAQVLFDGVTLNTAAYEPPVSGTYRFWIKAVDQSGIPSHNAVDTQATIDVGAGLNIVFDPEELPEGVPYAEMHYMTAADTGARVMWLPGMADTDAAAYADTDAAVAYYPGDYRQGVYTTQVYDIGAEVPFDFRMSAEFESVILGGVTDLTYASRSDMSYPRDSDVSIAARSSFKKEYRLARADAVWSDWVAFASALGVTARYVQMRYTTNVEEAGATFAFTRLAAVADVAEQETSFDAAISAAGTVFEFEDLGLRPMLRPPYYVGVTVVGTAALSPAVVKESARFTVRCLDGAGAAHAAQVNITVKGF